MTVFIGAEYLIGNMLINKIKECKRQADACVLINELNQCGVRVRHIAYKEDIDAIFLTFISDIYNAIYDFTDYFTCKYEDGRLAGITINSNKQIADLESRFIKCVPPNITRIFEFAIKELNYTQIH